jgi:outer membrane lipoprotein-sorting protein
MKLRTFLLVFATAILAVPATAQTVDELLAKNYAARGGLDKLRAVKSIVITGRLEVSPEMQAPFTIHLKRPNQLAMEFTVQGMTAKQVYDGKSGWQIMPFNGKNDPEPMSADDLKDAAEQADIDGPLVDYKKKGNQIELAGKEDVEGSPAYKLKVTLGNGDIQYQYLDASSFLEVKEESMRTVQGAERDVDTTIGGYKEVQGLYYPFVQESSIKDGTSKQKVIVEKIELNAPVDDSVFKMPAPPPADTKPEKKKPEEPKPPGA